MPQARARAHSGYRATTSLTIAFGLVNIPVRVIPATDSKNGGRQFHQYHDHGDKEAGRVRQKNVCEVCNDELAFAEIVKGLEMPDGVLLFSKEELTENLPLTTMRSLEVLQFADASEVDSLLYDKDYFLEPDGPTSLTAYSVLMEAMKAKSRIGICKAALRQGKEHLAALRVEDGMLALTTMRWPAERRHVHFDVLDGVEVAPAMLKMAGQLVDSMTRPLDASEYTDRYSEALEEMIDAKAHGRTVAAPAAPAPTTSALQDALMASLGAVEKTGKSHLMASLGAVEKTGKSHSKKKAS